MLDRNRVEAVLDEMFQHGKSYLYAVVDGAATKELRFKIFDFEPEHCCLWAGKLEPDLEEVAPYLIKLSRNCPMSYWLVEQGWGQSWFVLFSSDEEFKAVRKHLRQFLLVKGPEGQSLLFRFYDPRVLSDFAVVAEKEQQQNMLAAGDFIYEQLQDNSVELNTWRL